MAHSCSVQSSSVYDSQLQRTVLLQSMCSQLQRTVFFSLWLTAAAYSLLQSMTHSCSVQSSSVYDSQLQRNSLLQSMCSQLQRTVLIQSMAHSCSVQSCFSIWLTAAAYSLLQSIAHSCSVQSSSVYGSQLQRIVFFSL